MAVNDVALPDPAEKLRLTVLPFSLQVPAMRFLHPALVLSFSGKVKLTLAELLGVCGELVDDVVVFCSLPS